MLFDIPPPRSCESSPLSTHGFMCCLAWSDMGSCWHICRPHITIVTFAYSSVASGCNPLFLTCTEVRTYLTILFHRPQAASCENKHVIAACDCIHAHLSRLSVCSLLGVSGNLASLCRIRPLGKWTVVVADRVGCTHRCVVSDRVCSNSVMDILVSTQDMACCPVVVD